MARTGTGQGTIEYEGVGDERETTTGVGTTEEGPDFEVWYRALHPRLVAAVLLSTGHLDDAAEVADESMVRALERWSHVRTMASPDGWVFQVAFNLVRRRGRRRALEQTVLRRSAAGATDVVAGPAGEAWDAVRHLTPRQRQVVVLRYVADLPEAEIAEVLGISRGTVSSTLADAKGALRVALIDPEPERGSTPEPAPEPAPAPPSAPRPEPTP